MKIHVNKKRWRFAILNVFFAILFVFFAVFFVVISNKLDSVNAAERWRAQK